MNRKLIYDKYGYFFRNPKTGFKYKTYQYIISKNTSYRKILLRQSKRRRYYQKPISIKNIELLLWIKEL